MKEKIRSRHHVSRDIPNRYEGEDSEQASRLAYPIDMKETIRIRHHASRLSLTYPIDMKEKIRSRHHASGLR